jgi:hypothetical protein
MHRKYPFVGGLALGLILLAAATAATGSPADYSGATPPGLPSVGASQNSTAGREAKTAENDASSGEDAATEEARKRLKNELDRVRKGNRHEKAESKPAASQPGKKPTPDDAHVPHPQPQKPPVPAIDPEINRAAGKLIIMRFSGSEPSDSGPKAIRSLIHDGLIAGVMFGGDNIQSKTQLKELIKFLGQGGGEPRPLLAISEIGGAGGSFPHIKDFESWPSEHDVASQGDPEYAYLTYRSLGTFLAGLGFNLNFGPALGAAGAARDPAASFSESPLQAGVFAKTFILGHRDDNIITVPVVDSSDVAVRALKTLLVSYPVMPIAVTLTSDVQPFAAYDGLVRGPRFCLITLKQGADPAEAASPFYRGCDAVVIDAGKEGPAVIRDLVARGVSNAIKSGSLSLAALNASAQKLSALRSPSQSAATAVFSTPTAQ